MNPVVASPVGKIGEVAAVPLTRLWEADGEGTVPGRGLGMPDVLAERYDGRLEVSLRSDRPTVIANFVTTLDGIVAFEGGLTGGHLISGSHEPDRFVMALLRALSDVVVVGAGTFRGSSRGRWTAADVHPPTAGATHAWRQAMGLPPVPTTVVVTATGQLPLDHRAFAEPDDPLVIATTTLGAQALRGGPLSARVRVLPGEAGRIGSAAVLQLVTTLGARLVLLEGGPHLLSGFLGADLLDELFLTLSPQLVGRGAGRLGLVEGLALPPRDGRWQRLVSVRRSTDHLFLRYRRVGHAD